MGQVSCMSSPRSIGVIIGCRFVPGTWSTRSCHSYHRVPSTFRTTAAIGNLGKLRKSAERTTVYTL